MNMLTDFCCGGGGEFEYVGHWGPAESVFGHYFGFIFGCCVQAADVIGHAVGVLFAGDCWKDNIVPFVSHAIVAVNRASAVSLVFLKTRVLNKSDIAIQLHYLNTNSYYMKKNKYNFDILYYTCRYIIHVC